MNTKKKEASHASQIHKSGKPISRKVLSFAFFFAFVILLFFLFQNEEYKTQEIETLSSQSEALPLKEALSSPEHPPSPASDFLFQTLLTEASPSETALLFQRMSDLQKRISALTDRSGETWNVYVKDLSTNSVICTGSQRIYSASLCKLFVMEYWGKVLSGNFSLLDSEAFSNRGTLRTLLIDMIEYSDNDSYNELVRCIGDDGRFESGCKKLNVFLKKAGYEQTRLFHTLHPSSFAFTSISERRNFTTVSDCAALLEKIYIGSQNGDHISAFLMDLLLNQDTRSKIPAGLPPNVISANKTGETDEVQHDAAIVFGPDTDYLLCIMCSNCQDEGDAIAVIQKISSEVFACLNPSAS